MYTGNPPTIMWSSGTLHEKLYGLSLPTLSLSLVVTSHLTLEVFAWQLLLSGIVYHLTFVLAKLSQHSADIENLIFRSTSESRPNSIEEKNVRPPVRPYVRTSVRPQKVSSI